MVCALSSGESTKRLPSWRHAVFGGSLAGLLAARALADHFDRVTVLECKAMPHQ
jgi:hypothetical protein